MAYKQYCVYLLSNRRKTVLHTGVTNDLLRRVWQHKQHAIPGFTKKYNCDCLVHFEGFDEIVQAIAREKQIKGWTRAKKNALIAAKNPRWSDLAAEWYPDHGTVSFAVAACPEERQRRRTAQDDTKSRGSG